MNGNSLFDRASQWTQTSIGLKILVISILVLIFLVPSAMIQSLIRERQQREAGATKEISSHWAAVQNVGGPILTIPFENRYEDEDGKTVINIEYARFLPEELSIQGTLDAQTRYRGIYEALVYTADLTISGSFPVPSFDELGVQARRIQWENATVAFLISDLRGLRDYPTFSWNDSAIATRPGSGIGNVSLAGIHAPVSIDTSGEWGDSIRFSASLLLKGSRGLYVFPFGRESNVKLVADWPSPSFRGPFLPDHRDISADGFTAEWKVLDLNRSYPQKWFGTLDRVEGSQSGVDLIYPVDEYQQTMRSAKYSVLFVVLTFVTVFLVEIVNRRRVHPFQYLLIGCALMVFFVLLLSLAEHIPFGGAYLVASLVMAALIAGYARAILRRNRGAVVVAGIVAVLYGVLYVLLRLEDFALLVGSIGLVLAVAAVMYFTRGIDWYRIRSTSEE